MLAERCAGVVVQNARMSELICDFAVEASDLDMSVDDKSMFLVIEARA